MNQKHIKQTALTMIEENGLINLSKINLCYRAGIPEGSFYNIMGCSYTKFVAKLKKEVRNNTFPTVSKNRVDAALRKEQILKIAIEQAIKVGCHNLRRENIAAQAGVSMGMVTHCFGTMVKLRRAVIRHALTCITSNPPYLKIIGYGLVNNDKYCHKKTSEELKKLAYNSLQG